MFSRPVLDWVGERTRWRSWLRTVLWTWVGGAGRSGVVPQGDVGADVGSVGEGDPALLLDLGVDTVLLLDLGGDPVLLLGLGGDTGLASIMRLAKNTFLVKVRPFINLQTFP